MRHCPTFRAFALLAATGIAVAACGGEGDEYEDAIDAPNRSESDATEKKAETDKDAPPFEAKFDPEPAGDPAPPNADQCIDNADPGGSENTATVLPDTDDCDDELKMISGIAKGPVDVDFYKLSTTDRLGCWVETDFEIETAGTELCVFARCKGGSDGFGGCEAGTESKSDIGVKGCCAAGPGRALPKMDCSGLNDSVDYFLRVRQPNGERCLPYKAKYRF